jgi:hypothetical protein
MSEIAFKTIAELVVALFAVAFFLIIIEGMLPGATGNTFCSIGNSIASLPLPSYLKPSLDQCGLKIQSKKQVIEEPFNEAMMSQYVMQCWKDNGEGHGGLTHDCFELFILEVSGNITESSFTDYQVSKDLCASLPNNFLEEEGTSKNCGDANRLFWKYKGGISGSEATVVIKYNAFDHRIEII